MSVNALHVTHQDYPIEVFLHNTDRGRYDMKPPYQRTDFIWDTRTKSRLVETILLGLPIGTIYQTTNAQGLIEPIDGLQRLTTILAFLRNHFKLLGLDFMKDLDGKQWNDLSTEQQAQFLGYPLKIVNLPLLFNGSDIRPIMFDRLNGGSAINSYERIMGTRLGKGNDLIKRLAPEFLSFWDDRKATQRAKRKRAGAFRDIVFAIMAQQLKFARFGDHTAEELGFADFALRRGGNKYQETWTKEVVDRLNKASDADLAIVEERFLQGCQIIKAVFEDCLMSRYSSQHEAKVQRTNTVATIVQFFATTAIERPLRWWVQHRAEILKAYEVISHPSRPDFLANQLAMAKLLREWAALLDKIDRGLPVPSWQQATTPNLSLPSA